VSHHGKKHGKRRKHRPHLVCARCMAPQDGSAAALLGAVAQALNACTDAGMKVRLRHGIVETREGYVLPLKDDRWTPRTRAYDPLIVPAVDPAGLDDD